MTHADISNEFKNMYKNTSISVLHFSSLYDALTCCTIHSSL